MTDLIERLNVCANDPMWCEHAEVQKSLLREAGAALEAARELANKWRKSEGGPYAYVAMQCAEQLDTAIDQARGKPTQ